MNMRTARSRKGSIVFDLDGVVYLGSTPIPGAAGTVANLLQDGWQVLFATNNSTKTPRSIVDVLSTRTGLAVDPATIVTSGMAAAAYLERDGVTSAFVVGSRQLKETLTEAGIAVVDHESPDAVVVGLDRDLTYRSIADASAAIRAGAVFVATNTDLTLPTPTGLLPGAGTIAAAISAASGVEPIVCGKPHAPMLRLLNRMLTGDQVWMIGDRPETDIAFAKAAGWRSILTLTGVTSGEEDLPSALTPDHVISSITDLERLLAEGVGALPNEG